MQKRQKWYISVKNQSQIAKALKAFLDGEKLSYDSDAVFLGITIAI